MQIKDNLKLGLFLGDLMSFLIYFLFLCWDLKLLFFKIKTFVEFVKQ